MILFFKFVKDSLYYKPINSKFWKILIYNWKFDSLHQALDELKPFLVSICGNQLLKV